MLVTVRAGAHDGFSRKQSHERNDPPKAGRFVRAPTGTRLPYSHYAPRDMLVTVRAGAHGGFSRKQEHEQNDRSKTGRFVRAPTGTRTQTGTILSRLPLPIGLWGPVVSRPRQATERGRRIPQMTHAGSCRQ